MWYVHESQAALDSARSGTGKGLLADVRRRAQRGGGDREGQGGARRARGAVPGGGRAGHLVLLRPLAVLHPRVAERGSRGPRQVFPHAGDGDRARHPLLLGRAHGHDVLRHDREVALPHRVPARPGEGREGSENVQIARQRGRPAQRHRRARLRRPALHPRHRHRRGPGPQPQHGPPRVQPQLHQQDLELRQVCPLLPRGHVGRRTRRARRRGGGRSFVPGHPAPRGAVDRVQVARRRRPRHVGARQVRLWRSRPGGVLVLLRRFRGLVHRGGQVQAVRRRPGRREDHQSRVALRLGQHPARVAPVRALRHRGGVEVAAAPREIPS